MVGACCRDAACCVRPKKAPDECLLYIKTGIIVQPYRWRTQHAASLQRTLAYFDTTSPEECPERIPQTHKNVALLLCHTAGGRSVLCPPPTPPFVGGEQSTVCTNRSSSDISILTHPLLQGERNAKNLSLLGQHFRCFVSFVAYSLLCLINLGII